MPTATGNLRQTLSPAQKYVRWYSGNFGYILRNSQKVIRQAWHKACDKSQKFYIECTRRIGKSTFLVLMASEICIKKPNARCGFYAPVRDGLRDYILPIISRAFEDCPDDLKPTLDVHLTLTFPNGSTIIFRGSNNQQHNRRRGVDLDAAFIDEARDVDDLDSLIESVIMPALFRSNGPLLISSTPADTDDHPLKVIRDQSEREGWSIHLNIYDAQKHDKEEFPLERIEQWKRETIDPVAWQREYMAMWVKDPTKIIVPEWNDDCAVDTSSLHDQYFQFYHKYVSMDSGVIDKTVDLFGYYDFKRAKIVIEDEFVMQGSDVRTDRIAEMVKSKEYALDYQKQHDTKSQEYQNLQQHERMRMRISDNNDPILINDLNSLYHLNFIPTSKDTLAAMINAVRELVKDKRILVDKRCVELLGCLRNAVWDKNKKDLAKSKVFGHFDALMALVYLVRNVDFSTNPIPRYFGQTWATHPGVPMDAHKPNTAAWQIASAFSVKTENDKARSDFARGRF